MEEREFVERCCISVGVSPTNLNFRIFVDCIVMYMQEKGYKYNYTKVKIKNIYETVAQKYNVTSDRVTKCCFKSIALAFERTRFKNFYQSFYISAEEIKPSMKEFCELLVLKYKYEVLGNEANGIDIS